MTHFEQLAWTPSEAPTRSEPAGGVPPSPGGAVGFLLAHGLDPQRELQRITLGLLALGVISVLLINFGIYQSTERNLARDRWRQLVAETEEKCSLATRILDQFQDGATFVAGQSDLQAWAADALAGRSSPASNALALSELKRSQVALGYDAIHLEMPDGAAPLTTRPLSSGETARHSDTVRRASITHATVAGDVEPESGGRQILDLAVPIVPAGARGPVPVAVIEVSLDDLLAPVLSSWPGLGSSAGAYLVQQQGDRIVFLSTPHPNLGIPAGGSVAASERRVRIAAMAAAGVESSVEGLDGRGGAVMAVTRRLPGFQWGLVAHVDRSEMMKGMRGTLAGLLAMDLAIVVLALLGLWLWRRQYATGIARHEMEVTRRHAERVQAVFDTAFDAIVTFDSHGRVRSVNRAAEALTGRAAPDLEGQPLQRYLLWGPSGKPSQELPAPGTVCRAEVLKADGSLLPVEFSLGLSGHGDDLLYSAIIRDISERVEAERRIKTFAEGLETSNRRLEELNAQLEEASRLKSEFLANTSHELRTPLNGILGFLQLVLDGMCDSREEEQDFLRQALHCSRHLLGLINDVLDIAKIEAGKLTLEIAKVDVPALFDEVYTLTHVQAAQKGIKLRFEPPANRSVGARGDFGKTKQILVNLVGNSLKFTPRGSITVRAIPHPELGHLMFEIVDTGIGIASDRQNLIFDKFTQGDGSTTRKYGGTGLGLAISRSLVELMGGIIGVQSDGEGKGTRVYFSLPVWHDEAEDPEIADKHSERIAGPAGGPLVLVVEDDPVSRRFLAALLQKSGYRTVDAANAETGWVLARRLRPSVVVLDYALTSAESATLRTGWDLAQRMTTDTATRHIPLVFVTGFDSELKEKLRATAFARHPEHLMKPVDGKALVSKIQELVGNIQGRVVRVLMADDDPSVGAYIRKVLPEERYLIEMASDGEECLHILRTQPNGFDLLLLDLMMPEVSGYEVLKEMALAGVSRDLPVLVLTNFPEPRNEEEKRLLEAGLVLDVLPKTSVHENPQLLAHIIDWHLQVAREQVTDSPPDALEERKAA
jgi:PAS domain S-box-containing protein